MILALVSHAVAQACVCSRNVALPSGNVSRSGEVVATLDYGLGLSGATDGWRGFSVTDRLGDSMAGMYMPPHLVQTASITAAVGLPEGFAVSTTVPYIVVHHLQPSEMPGDVDSSSLADLDVTASWGVASKDERRFAGATAGLTFPTGEVVPDSPVRSGRGTFGVGGGIHGGLKVHPKAAVLAAVTGSTGFGTDTTGYVVAPSANGLVGGRWSPRENGRFSLASFGMLRWQGKDRQDALTYENTGFLTLDLALGAGFTFWEKGLRSAALSTRVQAPLWQVVGDPMYAENFGATLGISVVAW